MYSSTLAQPRRRVDFGRKIPIGSAAPIDDSTDVNALANAVGEQVGAALTGLHGAGFVHCDVTPMNILYLGSR